MAPVKAGIKNTFLEFTNDEEEATWADVGRGLRRASSCPSLSSHHATSDDAAGVASGGDDNESRSESPGLPPAGASWADLSCCDCEQEWITPAPTPKGPSEGHQTCGGLDSQVELAAEATKPPPPSSGPVVVRTPLRREAPSFVPQTLTQKKPPAPPAYEPRLGFIDKASVKPPAKPQPAVSKEKVTTAIVRNVPCRLQREALITLLNQHGFEGDYDFVYLPIDFKTKYCMGYAFVNLTSEEKMQRFTKVFQGFGAWPCKSKKVCEVSASQTQGLTANIERYRNSPMMGDEVPDGFKPVVFEGTRRVPFLSPTKPLPKVIYRQ